MTEMAFWGKIQTALRTLSLRWKPRRDAKIAARRPNQSANKRMKYEYQCAMCKNWFRDDETEMDHIKPCCSSQLGEDIVGYINRLFCEVSGWRVLCRPCHLERHESER